MIKGPIGMPKNRLQRRARRRAWLIIGGLLIIGLASIAFHISLHDNYSIADALFDIGKECLTAAIFFVLIDQAIGHYEERQQMRSEAVDRLRGDEGSKTLMLDQLASGARISGFNLSDSTTSLSLELEGKIFTSCQLDRCDLDGSSFNRCGFKDVSLRESSLRLVVTEDTKFESVHFDRSDVTGSLFVNCSFDARCTFSECSLSEVRFNNCAFSEHALRTMRPAGAIFNSCAGIDDGLNALLADLGAIVGNAEIEVQN